MHSNPVFSGVSSHHRYSLFFDLSFFLLSTICFRIEYFTAWGESLVVEYEDGCGSERCCDMEYVGNGMWKTCQNCSDEAGVLRWRYAVRRDGETIRTEEGGWREMPLRGECREIDCWDSWQTESAVADVFRHSAFAENIFSMEGLSAKPDTLREGQVLFLVGSMPMPGRQRICMVGSTESLGKWNPSHGVMLQRIDTYLWGATLPIEELQAGIEYKFVIEDEGSGSAPIWEEGENRCWRASAALLSHSGTKVIHCGGLRTALLMPRWAGVAVPLFSLRGSRCWGAGDFRALKDMATWAAGRGLRFVQILPINDTTSDGSWRDSYPYSARSVFALHPLYLDTTPWSELPFYAEYDCRGKELESLPTMDYEATLRLKYDFLDALYLSLGKRMTSRVTFKKFEVENAFWLPAYAKLLSGMDLYGKRRSAKFFCFVQYLLHEQLLDVHAHFRELGVVLKGDIPIGVSADSVSAKTFPQLFHLDASAGAPPDDFAAEGQNWGFPTYDWERMAEDGYGWWKERLKHLGRYFDAVRIDHVLGFFRIWEVPRCHVGGLLGHFRPALPLSGDELRRRGFTLPPEFFSKPHLTENMLMQMGLRADEAFLNCFQREGGYLTLKPEYITEKGIMKQCSDEATRGKLLACLHEVLFVEDSEQRGMFHPRINAYQTQTYKNLPQEERRAFDMIYEDFFYVRHNALWAAGAEKKLSSLFTGKDAVHGPLPCAEDLGMVPSCVPEVLQSCGLLSLELRRMPKKFGVRLADLSENPYFSVDTISTHDMPPLRLWWRSAGDLRDEVWHGLHIEGMPPQDLPSAAAEKIVMQHLCSPSMLCILAMQDWLAVDDKLRYAHPEEEQINIPANPDHNWNYRLHINMESLMEATPFNEKLRSMILQSGRGED